MNQAHTQQAFAEAAVQSFDAAEYVVQVLENGTVVYTECDDIVLDFGTDLI